MNLVLKLQSDSAISFSNSLNQFYWFKTVKQLIKTDIVKY